MLQPNNPAYSCDSNVKGQENDPAYYNPNNSAYLCHSNIKGQENDPAYYNPIVKVQDNLAHFNPKNQVVLEGDPAFGNTSR